MERKITLDRVIQIFLISIAVVIVLLAWPCKLLKQTITSDKQDEHVQTSEAIFGKNEFVQKFKPQYKNLESISVYIDNELEEDNDFTFGFYLFDQELKMVAYKEVNLKGQAFPGYCTVPLEVMVDTEKDYHYLLNSTYQPLYVAYANNADSKAAENTITYLADTEVKELHAISLYTYKTPFHFGAIAVLILISAVFVFMAGMLCKLICRAASFAKEFSLDRVLRTFAGLYIVILTLGLMIAIFPLKVFGTRTLDILFFEISCVLFGGTALWLIHKVWVPSAFLQKVSQLKLADGLQTVFFGIAVCYACEYVNATFEYTHQINSRRIILFVLLAVLCSFARKRIFHWTNAIALAILSGFGYFHTNRLIAEKLESELAIFEGVIYVVFGLVLLQLVILLLKRQIKRISIPYTLLTSMMLISLVIFGNGREWVEMLILLFPTLYLAGLSRENKRNTLMNIINGVLFSFVLITLYCLLHRPFHNYTFYRYPWFFHTVTISAMYFVAAFCAAFARVLVVYRQVGSYRKMTGTLILFGMVMSYLFLTISRTGIFTVLAVYAATALFILIANRKCARKENGKEMLKQIGVLVLVSVISFPIVFTATRIIPSVISIPERTEIEEFPYAIMEGEPKGSDNYIAVEHFFGISMERISGSQKEMEMQEEPMKESLSANLVQEETTAVTDREESAVEEQKIEDTAMNTYSNGRLAIWKAYFSNLNTTGHAEMSLKSEGEDIVHAHNSYLQVAYDHGIYVGILFILFLVVTLVRAIYYYFKNQKSDITTIFPAVVIGGFMITGIAEWAFQPCIPICLVFLLSLAPLYERIPSNQKSEIE